MKYTIGLLVGIFLIFYGRYSEENTIFMIMGIFALLMTGYAVGQKQKK